MKSIGICTLFVFCMLKHFSIGGAKKCEDGECCVGYRWVPEERVCVECSVGYVGPNCSLPCPPPFFGSGCNSTCNCSHESCHFANGCEERNESKVRAAVPQVRDATHSSTTVTNPTTEDKFTRQNSITKEKFTRHKHVKPHNADLGSVLHITIFLVAGLFLVVLICYLLTYSRWGRSRCTKFFPSSADMHPLEILEINEEGE